MIVVKMIYKLRDKTVRAARAQMDSHLLADVCQAVYKQNARQKVREICDSCVVNGRHFHPGAHE